MAFPTVLYGDETWVKKNKNVSKIKVMEMKLWSVMTCTKLDRIKDKIYMEGQWRGGPPACGLGEGLETAHHEKLVC